MLLFVMLWLGVSCLGVSRLGAAPLAAQGQRPGLDPGVDVAAIEKQLGEVEGLAGVDAATKKTLTEVLSAALQQAKLAQSERARVADFDAAVKSAPARLQDAKARLAQLQAQEPKKELPNISELAELSRRLAEVEAQQTELRGREGANTAERQRRTARLAELPRRIEEARDAFAKERSQSAEAREEPEVLAPARAMLARAKLAALEATLSALEGEKASYEAESELLVVDAQILERELANKNQELTLWRERVQAQRQLEAQRAAQQAAQEAGRAAVRENPTLRSFAAENAELAKTAERLAGRVSRTAADLEAAKKLRTNLEARFREIQKRIDIARLTEAIGLLLRQEKSRFPNVRSYQARIEERQAILRDEQLAQIDIEERIAKLETTTGPALLANFEVSEVSEAGEAGEQAETIALLREEAQRLLRSRADFLDGLRKNREQFISQLVELDTEEQVLVQKSLEYATFVNERVLWIRSTTPIWETSFDSLRESVVLFLEPSRWKAVLEAIGRALARSPVGFVLGALLALFLILLERPMLGRIKVHGAAASKGSCTRFLPTFWAFVLTLLAPLGLPFAFWHVATAIQANGAGGDFTVAVATGVAHAAKLWYGLALFRVTLRTGGLGEAHYRWQPTRTRLLRRHLVWFVPICVPLTALLRTLSAYNYVPWSQALDRIVLIALLGLIAVFSWFTLDVSTGALTSQAAKRPRTFWPRFFFVVALLVPTSIIVAAAAGYHFTALELSLRLISSLGVVLASVLVYGLAVRWMLLVKRKIAIEQARTRYEAAKKAREAERAAGSAAGGDVAKEPAREVGLVTADEEINLAAVDAQTKTLLRGALAALVLVALWGIWIDVLPALNALDRVALWETNVETSSEGGTTETKLVPITLGALLFACLVLAITFASARNVPGLLELSLLRRLEVQAGERYAITTLVRYAIVGFGIVFAFSSIGIGWGKVQWLVAAVSVGLGFGLQEIFANFVSGIILLFERPIRIGDLVTVAGIDGYVSRIRMRATTIVDFDRREMVVPNKEFVTNSLVNWTLTDAITRVAFKVGVAYGSDTALVRELLLGVARSNKIVLDEPAPHAIFFGFGDSSLDFQLRVFMPNRDLYPQLVNEINSAIDKVFKEHGIEIPFPQRDLHIRSMTSLQDLLPPREAAPPHP